MEKIRFHVEFLSRSHGWWTLEYKSRPVILMIIEDARHEIKKAKARDKRSLRTVEYRIVKKVTTTEVVS